MSFVEHEPIAGLHDRCIVPGFEVDHHAARRDGGDGADAHTAGLREAALHEPLMIVAAQEARGESAREALREIELLLPRRLERPFRECGVERSTISLRRG